MGADKNTILENAQLYTSKGQYDKAVAEWKKLATGTPADGTIFNTIGDLHLKRNVPGEAIEAYFQAAAAFRAGDAALKAIALYKKILKVDPSRLDAYRCLGDLNAERGLVSNAVSDYLALAKMYIKAGKVSETMEIYRKVTALDPANVEARQYLGESETAPPQREPRQAPVQPTREAALPSRQPPPADTVSAGAAKTPQEYSRQGYLDDAIKLTAGAQYSEAEDLLMEVLSREPGDPEVCRLLATLHLKRGELACAKAEFQFLAEAAMRAHDYVLAESMLLEYLKADPACIALHEMLGRLYEQSGDGQSAVEEYGKALEGLQAHPDPEYPTLPSELYEKIVSLAPSSWLVGRFAADFPGLAAAAAAEPKTTEAGRPAESRYEEPRAALEEEPAEAKPSGPLAFKFTSSAAPASAPPQAEEAATERDAPPMRPVKSSGSSFKFAGRSERVDEPSAGEAAAHDAPVQPAAAQEPAAPAEASRPDYDEHFQLGLAFRQMGLPQEAVPELEIALNDGRWFAESCRLLAQCFNEQGQRLEAIGHLERAMADPRAQGEAGFPVRYDLGRLYESEGSLEQALQVFSSIPFFEDVPERLARLSRGDAPAPGRDTAGSVESGVVAVGHGAAGADGGTERKKRRISYL